MEDPDPVLMQCFARKGDREALGRLFTRHAPEAYRTARLILRDPGAAEDAVQEAFSRLIAKASSYDPSRPFLPWLRSLVAHAALGRARSDRRRAVHEAAAVPGRISEDPAMRLIDSETLERLRGEIDALPEDLRLPVSLHYQAGYSYVETAEALGCPEGTVATRLAAARERLKTALAASGVILAAGVSLEDAAAAAAPPVGPVSATLSAVLQTLAASAKLPGPTREGMPSPAAKPLAITAGVVLLGLTAFLGWKTSRVQEPGPPPPPKPIHPPPAPERTEPPPVPAATSTLPASAQPTVTQPASTEAPARFRPALKGRVLCKETGRPVPGALLYVMSGEEGEGGDPPRPKQSMVKVEGQVTADSEGRYSLDRIPPREDLSFVVHGKDCCPCRDAKEARRHAAADGDGRFDFELSRAWGLTLRIHGPDGKPAREAGAVLTTLADDPDMRKRGVIGLVLIPTAEGFEVSGLDPGAFPPEGATVTVSSPGSRPSRPIPLRTATCVEGRYLLDVILEPGRTLVGMVLGPDGAPLPGTQVVCWPTAQNLLGAGFASAVQRTETRQGGVFEITGLPSGEALSLWAQGPDGAMKVPVEIPAGAGSASATLRLDAEGQVSGRILDGKGQPLPDVKVEARFTAFESVYGVERSSRTDEQGRFSLKGLPDWPALLVTARRPTGTWRCEFGWVGVPVGTGDLEITLPDCSGQGKHDHPDGIRHCPKGNR